MLPSASTEPPFEAAEKPPNEAASHKEEAPEPQTTESKPQDFSEVISESKLQLELLKATEGLVDPDHPVHRLLLAPSGRS